MIEILRVLANFCRIFTTAYIVEVKHCPKSQDIHNISFFGPILIIGL